MTVVWVEGIDHKGQKHLSGCKKLGCERENCKLEDVCFGHVTKNHDAEKCSVCKYCHLGNCHYEIQSLCYVPCYFNMVKQRSKEQQSSTVTVAASMLIGKLLEVFRLYSESPNKCMFDRISQFAWDKYACNKFVFEEHDLESLSSREKNIFFSVKSDDFSCDARDDDGLVFFFSHVLLQELLASLWLLSRDNNTFKSVLEGHKKSFIENFSVISEFMYEIFQQHRMLRKCRRTQFWNISPQNYKTLQEILPINLLHGC